MTGFLSANDEAFGRPAGLNIDRSGALLIADDVGNVVWRVSAIEKFSAKKDQMRPPTSGRNSAGLHDSGDAR
jgi:hypothetical protein